MAAHYTSQRASIVYYGPETPFWPDRLLPLKQKYGKVCVIEKDNHFQSGDYWYSDLGHIGYSVYRNSLHCMGDRNFGSEDRTGPNQSLLDDLGIKSDYPGYQVGVPVILPTNPSWQSLKDREWSKGFCKPKVTEEEKVSMFLGL